MSSNSEILMEIIVAIALFCAGGLAIVRPHLLQRRAIQDPLNPWRHYVTTTAYLVHLRIIGVIAVAMAGIVVLDLYVRWTAR
jgi:hypothetical protein